MIYAAPAWQRAELSWDMRWDEVFGEGQIARERERWGGRRGMRDAYTSRGEKVNVLHNPLPQSLTISSSSTTRFFFIILYRY